MNDKVTSQFAEAMAEQVATRTPKPMTSQPVGTRQGAEKNALNKRQRMALADWLSNGMMHQQVIGMTCKEIADKFNLQVGWNHPLFKAPDGIKDTAATKVTEWNVRHILINNGYGTLNYKVVKLDPVKMDELAKDAEPVEVEAEPTLPAGISQQVVFTTSDGKTWTSMAAAEEHQSIGILAAIIDDLFNAQLTVEASCRSIAKYIRDNYNPKV